MNAFVLPVVLALDFLLRAALQQTPAQEMKPYLLLPIPRRQLIDSLLLRTLFMPYNLIWLSFFTPFAAIAIGRYFGITGTVSYLAGIMLLIIANNYWYLLCRTLINGSMLWCLLPATVYAGMAYLLIRPEDGYIYDFLIALGDGFIHHSAPAFLGTLLVGLLLLLACRHAVAVRVYAELERQPSTRHARISPYAFFDCWGEVGEYMKLELKMLLRNRRYRISLRSIGLIVIIFALVLGFTELYDNDAMRTFVCVYNFSVFGSVLLSQLLSAEGNYIDGLMVRPESVCNLLRAKYIFYAAAEVIPLLFMLPAILGGKLSWLGAWAWVFYTIGVVYFCFFQLAVYNKQTQPLNQKLTAGRTSGSVQQLVTFASLGVPVLFFLLVKSLMSETTTYILLLATGIAFTLTSPLWIRSVCRRFMARRYENMEGFRNR